MCGRFTLQTSSQELVRVFSLVKSIPNLIPRWNVAPTQKIVTVRQTEEGREPAWMRWGLIPFWAKDSKISASLINARADTIAEKPSFRTPFRKRRCLILADGFYEWLATDQGKTPYLITMQDKSPFAFAGLWEQWKNPAGESMESCTAITTNPNALMATIHDRMPVILPREQYDNWLDPTNQDAEILKQMLLPFPPEEMELEEVSKTINNARNEVDPRLPKL